MPKQKICFFELEPWEKEYLSKKFKGKNYELQFIDDHLNDGNVRQIKDADILGILRIPKLPGHSNRPVSSHLDSAVDPSNSTKN